ncbi:MAG: hypothetical protein QXD66_06055 [Candidatus Nezhaarchaeales archaeon]
MMEVTDTHAHAGLPGELDFIEISKRFIGLAEAIVFVPRLHGITQYLTSPGSYSHVTIS